MGEIKDRWTLPWEPNAPRFQFDEDRGILAILVTDPKYVATEDDRTGRNGGWLYDPDDPRFFM